LTVTGDKYLNMPESLVSTIPDPLAQWHTITFAL